MLPKNIVNLDIDELLGNSGVEITVVDPSNRKNLEKHISQMQKENNEKDEETEDDERSDQSEPRE